MYTFTYMIQQEFSSIIFTLYFIYYFFSDTEQNSSRIKVSEQNFEQNKRFLRALPTWELANLRAEFIQA